jgi:2-dehydro-3-deoxyphosphogluconate aldolase/(4S)-4-hydroxy-2-oxoglutarate aldolase
MKKEEVLEGLREGRVVAVVRAENVDTALKTAEACLKGGIRAIELTFTVPQAHKLLSELRSRFDEAELLLGAGTVLDPETARIAILEGASYIVAPCLNKETMRLCNRYRVPCMPGAMSIADIVAALECGADVVKIFPGEFLGPAFIKAAKGPLPQAELMPTGGVSLENIGDWFKAGVFAVGVGGKLTEGAKKGDFASVEARARELVAAAKASA